MTDDDNDAATFAKLEAEWEERENARLEAWANECLETHRWDGGYFCRCGRALNSANGWGRHLLAVALEIPEPGHCPHCQGAPPEGHKCPRCGAQS